MGRRPQGQPPPEKVEQVDDYFLEPSVAQPPLPLQLFLPLQPWSPVEQPPLPLQEFLPAQECLSALAVVDFDLDLDFAFVVESVLSWGEATARAAVPPSKPARAAAVASEVLVIFIVFLLLVRSLLPVTLRVTYCH